MQLLPWLIQSPLNLPLTQRLNLTLLHQDIQAGQRIEAASEANV